MATRTAETPTGRAAFRPGPRGTTLRAEHIGSRVALRPARATVHSVFRQACNIETDDGSLVTLLASQAGNLPHGIRCVLPEPEDFQALLEPGQRVAIGEGSLQVQEAGVTVDLSAASLWHCALPACVINAYSDASFRLLLELRAILREQAPAGGLVPLLLRDEVPSSALDHALQRRLLRALPTLREASLVSDASLAAQALEQLVGLGPGLTPSGDDFIVGYLAALCTRRSTERGSRLLLTGLIAFVTGLAARTNLISRQFILDALAGEVSEHLAELVRALCLQDDARFRAFASRVAGIGHSSGADSLVGLLFGFSPSLVLGQAIDLRAGVTPAAR